MKKTIVTLALVLGFLMGNSQIVRHTYMTEVKEWTGNKWETTSTNYDTDIKVTIFHNTMYIEAKKDMTINFKKEKSSISGEGWEGVRLNGIDDSDRECCVDIVRYSSGGSSVNLIYFDLDFLIKYHFK